MVALAENAADILIEVYEDERFNKSIKFNNLCKKINAQGLIIKRYKYMRDREQFIANNDLLILITCAGFEMLPATYVNNHLVKVENYPTKAELDMWTKMVNGGD